VLIKHNSSQACQYEESKIANLRVQRKFKLTCPISTSAISFRLIHRNIRNPFFFLNDFALHLLHIQLLIAGLVSKDTQGAKHE